MMNKMTSCMPALLMILLTISPGITASEKTERSSLSGTVFAEGKVGMQGAILDGACGINSSSEDQSVEIGVNDIRSISMSPNNSAKPFQLVLTGCQLLYAHPEGNEHTLQLFFDDAFKNETAGHFWLTGDSSGFGMVLENDKGEQILPGVPYHLLPEEKHSKRLNFISKLAINGAEIKPGSFNASVRFRLEYE